MTAENPDKPRLGGRFLLALDYAARKHQFQLRKGTDIPYLGHLLGVASIVIEDGGTEDEAIAALLHDAVEDQGGKETRAEIARLFGERVAEIVDGCTDADTTPKPPWRGRKEAYLAHLVEADESVLRVSLADKLYNARETLFDSQSEGPAVWRRFNATRDELLWYYGALLEVFRRRRGDDPLVREMTRVLDELRRAGEEAGQPSDPGRPGKARWERLTEFLRRSDQPRAKLTFDEMERILGGPLPAAARRHAAFWANTRYPYANAWLNAGYRVTRAGLRADEIAFFRQGAAPSPDGDDEPSGDSEAVPAGAGTYAGAADGEGNGSAQPADVILVGCVATKADCCCQAKDMYLSPLFLGRRRYAEAAGRPWFILSALYGLLDPERVIEPYEKSLKGMSRSERYRWASEVLESLERTLGPLEAKLFEIHAGNDYASLLGDMLSARRSRVLLPLRGLRLGEQIRWYQQRHDD